MKKVWHKPQLIIITRSKPEESVLTACKYYGGDTTVSSAYEGCFVTGCAQPCYEFASS